MMRGIRLPRGERFNAITHLIGAVLTVLGAVLLIASPLMRGEIDKALEPFGQVDTAINRRHPGTGLGLPLTKSMVEVHGGQLLIESKVGQGTLVRAVFPSERVIRDPSLLESGGRRAVGSPAE